MQLTRYWLPCPWPCGVGPYTATGRRGRAASLLRSPSSRESESNVRWQGEQRGASQAESLRGQQQQLGVGDSSDAVRRVSRLSQRAVRRGDQSLSQYLRPHGRRM
jgi:hypothetical protein